MGVDLELVVPEKRKNDEKLALCEFALENNFGID